MVVKIGGVTETKALNYRFTKEMNNLGRCIIILDDVDYSGDGIGDMSAKYTPEDYMFKDIIIEEPAETVVWKGRICKVQGTHNATLLLHGEDWLAQYKDTIAGDPLTGLIYRQRQSHSIADGEVKTVDAANERIYPKDPYDDMTDDQYNDQYFWLKSGSAGYKYEFVYPEEFKVSAQSFDGGNLDLCKTNDWDNVLGNRRQYALCAKSGTVLPTIYLELWLRTRYKWSWIFVSGLDIEVACHIRGGDYGTSTLQIYNWDTETWDNLATGDCNHDYETTYSGKSRNYVNDTEEAGLIKIKITATQADQAKYIIFDYLKIKVSANTTDNERVYKISDCVAQANNGYFVLDAFEASEIAVDDKFVVSPSCAALINTWLEQNDYKHTFSREIAEHKYPFVYGLLFPSYYEAIMEAAKQDERDVYVRHAADKVYYGLYEWQDKTLVESTDVILNILTDVDGEKLINRFITAGEETEDIPSAYDIVRFDEDSYNEYNTTYKTDVAVVPTIGTKVKARLYADAMLQTFSRLYKNIIVTLAGLGDYELGDVVELNLPSKNVADHYLVRRLGYDWQTDQTVVEFGKVPQQPTKKYDELWDKLREMRRRISVLERRIA